MDGEAVQEPGGARSWDGAVSGEDGSDASDLMCLASATEALLLLADKHAAASGSSDRSAAAGGSRDDADQPYRTDGRPSCANDSAGHNESTISETEIHGYFIARRTSSHSKNNNLQTVEHNRTTNESPPRKRIRKHVVPPELEGDNWNSLNAAHAKRDSVVLEHVQSGHNPVIEEDNCETEDTVNGLKITCEDSQHIYAARKPETLLTKLLCLEETYSKKRQKIVHFYETKLKKELLDLDAKKLEAMSALLSKHDPSTQSSLVDAQHVKLTRMSGDNAHASSSAKPLLPGTNAEKPGVSVGHHSQDTLGSSTGGCDNDNDHTAFMEDIAQIDTEASVHAAKVSTILEESQNDDNHGGADFAIDGLRTSAPRGRAMEYVRCSLDNIMLQPPAVADIGAPLIEQVHKNPADLPQNIQNELWSATHISKETGQPQIGVASEPPTETILPSASDVEPNVVSTDDDQARPQLKSIPSVKESKSKGTRRQEPVDAKEADKTKIRICGAYVTEKEFVWSLMPKGYVGLNFMWLCCVAIMRDWDSKNRLILNQQIIRDFMKPCNKCDHINIARLLRKDALEHMKCALEDIEQLYLPICDDNNWILLIVNLTHRVVEIYDSLRKTKEGDDPHQKLWKTVGKNLQDSYNVAIGEKTGIFDSFERVYAKTDTQTKKYDSGFYVIIVLTCHNGKDLIGYSKVSMSNYRKEVCHTLVYHRWNDLNPKRIF